MTENTTATLKAELAAANTREAALREALTTCITATAKALWLGAQAFDIYRRATGGEILWGGLTEHEQKAWIDVGSKIPFIALIRADNTPIIPFVPNGRVAPVWVNADTLTEQAAEALAQAKES